MGRASDNPGAPGRRRPRGRCAGAAGPAGFTLLELLLALAMFSVVGGTVAMILYCSSCGTSSQEQMRDLLVRNEVLTLRINEALAFSRRVLARGDDYLVLWTADTRSNGAPNLSELQRIERDPATGELRSYAAPDDLAEADDVKYDLAATDFNAVTAALKGSPSFPGRLWATQVTGWTTSLSTPDVRQSSFVGYRVTTTVEGASETAVGGATLRNF